jgi:protein phosphatase
VDDARENPGHQGMGCTAELITFDDGDYVLGHVGDSRTYLLRHGQLRQITHDHSLVQEELDKGLINRDEARKVSFRNVILRAVGVSKNLSVDLLSGKTMDGDIFLLCSDGLTDMIDDDVIRETMSLEADLYSRGERLIELANAAGGNDNITVVLCQVVQMLQ